MLKFKSTIIIALLIPMFVLLGILCCCFSTSVDAKEIQSSCHSEEHAEQTSQADDDCNCDQNFIQIIKTIDKPLLVLEILPAVDTISTIYGISTTAFDLSDHAPPVAGTSVPLYIKHSNLRI